jgi:hypothetical protein
MTRIYVNNKIHLRIWAATAVVFNFTDPDSTIQQQNYNSGQATTVWVLKTKAGEEWRSRTSC